MRCARCGRFISPETCLQGHDGTIFGQYPDDDGYTEDYYCESGTGCNLPSQAQQDYDELMGRLG